MKVWRKEAYQPVTSGWSPVDFWSAPLTKPVRAEPALLPNQAGFWILPQPAVSHSQPQYTRTMSQNQASRVSANKNRAIGGSGIWVGETQVVPCCIGASLPALPPV